MSVDAPQHAPRPLPLFLDMLRSETAASPERRAAALAGLAAYQAAPREMRSGNDYIERRHGRARLIGVAGTEANAGRPVVLIPSLINPPTILDLDPEVSLLRWLSARGWQAWLLDWGTQGAEERGLDIDGHIDALLMPLLRTFDAPPVLVGYCLGGTIAWGAAARGAVAGVATIAAPWRFAGYGAARDTISALWAGAREPSAAMGLVPMEVLQAGFWRLDPARTVAKYIAFGRMAPGSAAARAFVRLEDWANAGAPLPWAAGRMLFEDFVADDRPGRGLWSPPPDRLDCPAVEFVSTTDRIVPAATAAGLADRRELAAGHVGMIVGRHRMALYEPLGDWIAALPTPR